MSESRCPTCGRPHPKRNRTQCPACQSDAVVVVGTRTADQRVRRRKWCRQCGHKFETIEAIEVTHE